VNQYVESVPKAKRTIEFDQEWLSPCIDKSVSQNYKKGELVSWSPVRQSPASSFDNLEAALEISIHPDVQGFYSTYWSDNLPAQAKEGNCELLQPWNKDDFERLQENLIGHVLMKQRLGQKITLFIGLTDEDDFILTVDNESGAVMLEQVGREPTKMLANSIAEFIQQLSVPTAA
jgi:SecY interacting protein Syd